MIRVLIVDDQDIVRAGLRVIVGASPNIEVVGTAADGYEALEQVAALRPDLVVMDLNMPGMNGVRATQALSEQFPEIKILILTTYDDDEWVIDAIRAGAAGYMLKDSGGAALVAAIEGAIAGKTPVDAAVVDILFGVVRRGGTPSSSQAAFAERLSQRELDVLRLLATGLTNADIGTRLGLAEGTVRNHVTSLFAKLQVADRAQATALAWRYGLVRGEG